MKSAVALIFLFLFPSLLFSNTYTCSVCGQESTSMYAIRNIAGERQLICRSCLLTVSRCTVCHMPLQDGHVKRLDDGRLVCEEDFNAGIFNQRDGEEVFRETRRELERTFYRFAMTFPETNVTFTMVASDRLHELARMVYDPSWPTLNGFTKPTFYDEKGGEIKEKDVKDKHLVPARIDYRIYVLAGLPRERLMAVCAHEYGHVWHIENLKMDRTLNLERKTREAFCELVAYQLMDAMSFRYEKAVIEANLYTFGQASLLIETEKEYGFNRIVQWMKNGKDLELSGEDLDRIRLVDVASTSGATGTNPTSVTPIASVPISTVPDILMLKGILGSGNRKMALINNQTFSPMEQAKVKVGKGSVTVQVMEIREKSVIIKTTDSSENQELFLK